MIKAAWTSAVHLPLKPAAQGLCVILHDEVGSVRVPLVGPGRPPNLRAPDHAPPNNSHASSQGESLSNGRVPQRLGTALLSGPGKGYFVAAELAT
jgi:hypothetical protein